MELEINSLHRGSVENDYVTSEFVTNSDPRPMLHLQQIFALHSDTGSTATRDLDTRSISINSVVTDVGILSPALQSGSTVTGETFISRVLHVLVSKHKKLLITISISMIMGLSMLFLAASLSHESQIEHQSFSTTTEISRRQPISDEPVHLSSNAPNSATAAPANLMLRSVSCNRFNRSDDLGTTIWSDHAAFTRGRNKISAIAIRVHTTTCPCTHYTGGCIDGLQATYGSVKGSQFGQGRGQQSNIGLEADEVITGVYVGFAKLNFIVTTADGLCYLQFNTTRRSYGPYDAGCRGTVTSFYNLSSGLAYMSGIGGWCISGLTFFYY